MAEITASAPPDPKRPRRALPTVRMDMTPMVDLAFLLLTFFILTTTLRRLEGMDLVKHLDGKGDPSRNTLTFLIAGRDSFYAYAGPLDLANAPPRRMGLDQVRAALRAVPDTTGLTLLVKPNEHARYGNIVDLLDEFALAALPRYQVLDSMAAAEREALTLPHAGGRSLGR